MMQRLSSGDFDAFIGQHEFIILCFTSAFCAPCRSYIKNLEVLDSDVADVAIGLIDCEASPELAEEFDVASVPATMVMRSQVVLFMDTGILSLSALKDLLTQAQQLDMATVKQQD